MKNKSQFSGVSRQSELIKAGIRFDFNVTDTVCRRRCGISCALSLLILSLLSASAFHLLPGSDRSAESLGPAGTALALIFFAYVVFYTVRLLYYTRMREKMRQDRAPITVEAYAVMLLDGGLPQFDNRVCAFFAHFLPAFSQYAVIYKESGSKNPRYFLSAAVSAGRICFIPGHIARVFPHRKQGSRLYHLDDLSSYSTVSERRKLFAGRLSVRQGSADFLKKRREP